MLGTVPSQTPPTDTKSHLQITEFCARCFADSHGGSWGEGTGSGGCYNCGASGCTVMIPVWAVESIREQASWVGKRYYPSQEDKELSRELRYLRSIAPAPAGRTVERVEYDGANPNDWRVTQALPDGSTISTTVRADHAGGALQAAEMILPHPVPEGFQPLTKKAKH